MINGDSVKTAVVIGLPLGLAAYAILRLLEVTGRTQPGGRCLNGITQSPPFRRPTLEPSKSKHAAAGCEPILQPFPSAIFDSGTVRILWSKGLERFWARTEESELNRLIS